MTVLVDAGPIVAQLDRRQADHEQCVEVLGNLREPLLTCEAVIAEACHLLRRQPGARKDLLKDVAMQRFMVAYELEQRAVHISRLMDKYADIPMDLADACLVDMAAVFNTGRIVTLDADFRVYRWGRNRPFDLLIDF